MSLKSIGTLLSGFNEIAATSRLTESTFSTLKTATESLSGAQIAAALSTSKLSAQQRIDVVTALDLDEVLEQAILSTLELSTAQGTATAATGGLTVAFKGLFAVIKAHPVLAALSAVAALLPLIVKVGDAIIPTAEEATEKMDESVSAFEEATSQLESLNKELETTQARIDELEVKESLTFVEESELKKLRESVELLRIEQDLAEKKQAREAKGAADDTITAYRKNFKHDVSSDAVNDYVESSSSSGNNAILFSDESNVAAMLAGIEQMRRLRDDLDKSSEHYAEDYQHFQGVINDATDSLWEQVTVLNTYKANLEAIPYSELSDEQKQSLDEINAAIKLVYTSLDPAKWNQMQWNGIVDSGKFDNDIQKLNELAAQGDVTTETFKKQFPDLAKACEDAGAEIGGVVDNLNAAFEKDDENGVPYYTAKLSDLTDVLSKLRSKYDALESAQEDMASGNGLSADTIAALAKEEENYLDYLYEENGVIKLNTEAWKENANAKMLGEMDKIQNEIDSIEAENAALQALIDEYNEKKLAALESQDLSTYYSYGSSIDSLTEKIQANSETIAENQDKLAMWEAAFNGVTQAAANTVEGVSAALPKLNTVSGNIGNLSEALGKFGENGSLDLNTLSELSNTFGEFASFGSFVSIMSDSASSMEDAQEACNRLAAEYINTCDILDDVDESTAQLIERELEKMGVENAHELVQARLNAVQLEGQLAAKGLANAAWEAAEKTLVQSGASETAIASLKRLRQEQYNAKVAVLDFTTATAGNIEALIQQAKAAGAAASSISALSRLQSLQEGGFEPWRQRGLTLENYNAMLESARKAAQIDLSDVENISIPQVQISLPAGSSGGSAKEVEEYIADIDAYYVALKKLESIQLRRGDIETRIENGDNSEEKIALTKELINAYRHEAAALENLNDLRSKTIQSNIKELESLGFQIDYNAKTNEFFVKNLDHLNELCADSVGEYGSLQEATNALREETEGLIDSLADLNEENREGSQNLRDLKYSIEEALQEVVAQASEAVDTIQGVYDTLHDAADEYAASGYITVDTLQSIIDLGVKYVSYLMDENGQLVINEERIRAVIAAKTQQLAIESSLSYVEALRIAKQAGDIATLNDLLYATQSTTDATWGLVYANLALAGLDESQYQAALQNINAIRAMADSAAQSIGQTANSVTDELNEMKSGLDDILKYVMDMLKQRIEDQIQALEDMKDA